VVATEKFLGSLSGVTMAVAPRCQKPQFESLYLPNAKDFSHRKVDSGRVSLYPEYAGYFIQQNRVQQKVCTFHSHSVHPS